MIDRRHLLHTAALIGVAACAPKDGGSRLTIGFQRNGILFIARTRGAIDKRLEAAGITLAWTQFPSGPPLIEAMNAGVVDFGAVGDTPAIYAQAAGVAVKLIAAQVYAGQTPHRQPRNNHIPRLKELLPMKSLNSRSGTPKYSLLCSV
ncbi:hypothetical protein GCM10011529_20730 [Polymorphobacter glacialis]|uniref:SsuA/THI5-like domain-containing protein n=1 Tax=Sandarakinorhabdus glacialis TaxID=1614636 RepID=A0A916ZU21_9SPHN|nr:hypothetical protein [Polymorphobacter glacialis]GGE14170.1 hypothetical protein GCM10011529_20730 [Polymorphobacter glacialis]